MKIKFNVICLIISLWFTSCSDFSKYNGNSISINHIDTEINVPELISTHSPPEISLIFRVINNSEKTISLNNDELKVSNKKNTIVFLKEHPVALNLKFSNIEIKRLEKDSGLYIPPKKVEINSGDSIEITFHPHSLSDYFFNELKEKNSSTAITNVNELYKSYILNTFSKNYIMTIDINDKLYLIEKREMKNQTNL